MGLMERYEQSAVKLNPRERGMRVLSHFVHPDIDELIDLEQQDWALRDRRLRASGVPIAGLGFSAPIIPNMEILNVPTAVATTGESNLYSISGSNSAFAQIPAGTLRAPQTLRITASGLVTTTSSGTEKFTTRIGTSATITNNVSLGATGAITLGSSITNALWYYDATATVLTMGTSGTITSTSIVDFSAQAAGSVTSTNTGMSGNTTGTVDMTVAQAWGITASGGNTGCSCQITQFTLIAWD